MLPLEDEDIEELRKLRNSFRECFLTNDIISQEEQSSWFKKYLDKNNDIMFKIVKTEEPSNFIGAVALYDIDKKLKCAEFGRLIIDKEKCDENGLGAEATAAVSLFGFEILKLQKIYAEVFKNNIPAIKSYKKVGYTVEKEVDSNLYVMKLENHKLIK